VVFGPTPGKESRKSRSSCGSIFWGMRKWPNFFFTAHRACWIRGALVGARPATLMVFFRASRGASAISSQSEKCLFNSAKARSRFWSFVFWERMVEISSSRGSLRETSRSPYRASRRAKSCWKIPSFKKGCYSLDDAFQISPMVARCSPLSRVFPRPF